MNKTFDDLYHNYASKVNAWTNSLLFPPPEHIVNMLGACQAVPAMASRVANGFNDPRDYSEYWFDPAACDKAIKDAAAIPAA